MTMQNVELVVVIVVMAFALDVKIKYKEKKGNNKSIKREGDVLSEL